jgi:hypothetical protein
MRQEATKKKVVEKHDIKETLKIKSDAVGVLARDMNAFRRAVMRATGFANKP